VATWLKSAVLYSFLLHLTVRLVFFPFVVFHGLISKLLQDSPPSLGSPVLNTKKRLSTGDTYISA